MGIVKLLFRAALLFMKGEFVKPHEIAADYDQVAATYDAIFRREMEFYIRNMVENLPVKKGDVIIDLGCGTGAVMEAILEKEKDVKMIGVDMSEKMLDKAREKNLDVRRDEMLHFLRNMENESVDVIAAAWSLSYVPHKPFLKEAVRVLKKGGRVGVIINTRDTLKETRRAFISALRKDENMLIKLMPIYLPEDARDFARLMKRYGMEAIFMRDGEKMFHFKDGREALSFVLSTGALAGYKKCFTGDFEERVAQFHPSYAIHRFCIVVGMKRF